jgi:pSer/pThr/pTyr-binding forkhead associated (FHA) protein
MSSPTADPRPSAGDPGTRGSAHDATAYVILPTGQEWPLTGEVLTIGGEVGNQILIDDPTVSRQHAEIVRVGDDYVLLDLRSSNGTFVNGQQVLDLHILHDGDEIEVAGQRLRFTTPGADREPADTSARGASTSTADIGMLLFREVPLTERVLTIGRAPENQLVLDDARVSSEHAKIVRDGDDYWLVDLRSSNGTFVNEQRVRDLHRLQDGDSITIAATTLTFVRRTLQVEERRAVAEGAHSFVFADATGRRWKHTRIAAAVIVVLAVVFAALFLRFVLK